MAQSARPLATPASLRASLQANDDAFNSCCIADKLLLAVRTHDASAAAQGRSVQLAISGADRVLVPSFVEQRHAGGGRDRWTAQHRAALRAWEASTSTEALARALGPELAAAVSGKVERVEVPVFPQHCLVEASASAGEESLGACEHVVLGGTFDRLHAGHRKLLMIAGALGPQKVTVGVTGAAMLTGKRFGAFVEPFAAREAALREALATHAPGAQVVTEEISDPFGPSIEDASMEAIVVSSETEAGAFAVNAKRAQAGLPLLAVYSTTRENPAVQSSTFIRGRLAAADTA